MILDTLLQFSPTPQAITATVGSVDQIDLGPLGGNPTANVLRDIGVGEDLLLVIRTVAAFNNLTSLTFALQTDDNAAFSTPVQLWASSAVPLAQLTANRTIAVVSLKGAQAPYERFIRMNYTVAGTAPTTGSVEAFIVKDAQQYRAYADAQPIATNA